MDSLALEAVARIGALLISSDEHVQLAAARSVFTLAGIDPGRAEVRTLLGAAREPIDERTRREIDRIIAKAQQAEVAEPAEDTTRYAS